MMRPFVSFAVALLICVGTAHGEGHPSGATAGGPQESKPPLTRKQKLGSHKPTRKRQAAPRARKSSPEVSGESAVTKAWRDADI